MQHAGVQPVAPGNRGEKSMEKPVVAGKSSPKSRKDTRDERLAAELRSNLKRRKAAARGRDAADEGPEPQAAPQAAVLPEPYKV